MRKLKKIFNVSIWSWWILSLVGLSVINLKPFFTQEINLVSYLPQDLLIEDVWQGIYFNKEIIGYSNWTARVLDIKEGKGYLVESKISMNLPVLGVLQPINITTRMKLFSDYSLNNLRMNLDCGNYFFKIYVENKGNKKYLVDIQSPQSRKKYTLSICKDTFLHSSLSPLFWGRLPLKKRSKFKILDPINMEMQEVIIENMGEEKVIINDKELSLYKLKIRLHGIDCFAWVDKKGKVYKEKLLNFIFVRDEPQRIFKLLRGKKLSLDLARYFSIQPTGKKINPEARCLSVRLKKVLSVDIEQLNSCRQVARKEGGAIFIKVCREDLNSIPCIYSVDKKKFIKYLKEDFFIKTQDKKIKELLNKIIPQDASLLQKARILNEWVYKNVKKIPTFSVPNTLDVLKNLKGDCNEHSVLFCGLARGADLPCYINLGLVFCKGRFFYHAWPSVYVGRWIDVDPTLGQFPADSTHIKLSTQSLDKFYEILNYLGKMKIEVVEVK